jgi:polar amino acid transport system ATP-binding protein
MMAIMGPSGSGKSTLMHIVGLLDRPSTGVVTIDGVDVSRMEPNELAAVRNKRIGFVFQSFTLLARTTAQTNVELPLIYAGLTGAERARRARSALETVGLGERLGHMPNQLSGGQQQRVAIVRALAMEPKLLLLDEITSALDPELVSEVLNIVRDLARQGMTMLLATHEMGFAREVASKVCFLYGGVVHEEGPPEQIFGDPKDERTRAFLKRIIEAGRL